MSDQPFLNYLKTEKISFELHRHDPIFSALEADGIKSYVPGAHSKNLFLRDKKKNFFLVTVLDHKRINLKELANCLGQGHLSFGSSEDLWDKMKVQPGSVTPFALFYDTNQLIHYVMDEDILKEDFVNFHPLRNDMTVHMALKDFLNLMIKIHHLPQILSLPTL